MVQGAVSMSALVEWGGLERLRWHFLDPMRTRTTRTKLIGGGGKEAQKGWLPGANYSRGPGTVLQVAVVQSCY